MRKLKIVIGAVILITALFLCQSCNDNADLTSVKKIKGNNDLLQKQNTLPDTVLRDETEKIFILNQKNHYEFLREYFKTNGNRKIKISTRFGEMKIELFNDTPIHTSNFLMMTEKKYFNNTEFTRVVKKFIVQGGNNDKEEEEIKRLLIGNYEMKPEFHEHHIHKKGALAMARRYEENEGKLSSAYNFYIVQGQTFNDPQLLAIERQHNMKIPDWKREIYETIGGAPHLDGEHTVFGQVYEGFDVLEKMSNVKTDKSDWPLEPIIMQIEVLDEE